MKIKALSISLLAAFILGGCSGMSSTVDGKTHVFSGAQACPALLEMDKGQTIEVTLDENPSTGYVWALTAAPKLFKAEEIYQQEQGTQPTAGAGGQKTYRFTALQAGEEALHLQHRRAWEKTALVEWKCRVRIS